jgi:hypothetical protein
LLNESLKLDEKYLIWHGAGMRNDRDPKALGSLLRDYGDSGLRKIVRQAQRLLAMQQILQQCLPENLQPHCHVAQATATHLTVLVDGAAWLTHLRYFKPQLLQRLKTHPQCHYVQDVHCRIQPTQWQKASPEKPPLGSQLSAENKKLLQSTAETVSNPLLKRALAKLAR